MNVQYVIMNNGGESRVYVLEVNPRASRTVPFLSKVTGVPMVRLAVNCMLGYARCASRATRAGSGRGSRWSRSRRRCSRCRS